ncbi:MAG: protein translocase subunit secA [Actinomycetia bacterium]|nr:protein translocase subunit secA [Actinomycetes bacterium]
MSGLRSRMRRFLQKPGSASLGGYEELLPGIAGREEALRGLDDAGLTAAAAKATDDAGICALGREAARRALGERPFDVQLLGTLAMLSGQVAEMATGEGKTLSGALAAAGYVRRGHRVQVMSVNDYLARRDAEWMGPVYDLLGVSAGWVTQASTPDERREAYAADVCYGSANEIGFDALRDRLATSVADLVTAEPDVILIDEADSVLVDEALVPLVLAGSVGAADSGREMAEIAGRLLPRLHYEVDDERRNVFLTDAGARVAEQALGGINLYAEQNLDILTQLNVALHARALLQRDVDYLVRDDRIHLISASRGRVARRQRWPDGLHAAVEAKEGLRASESGQILDSITIQALVRRYPVACGMTGTAVAVGEQLREFYGLEIAVIPPNLPCVREDEPDRLYRTAAEKEDAVVSQVADTHATGRPVLIGTLDVAESERLAARMSQAGLGCVVLNAKNDAHEAAVVAEAGALGAITVSTQMAGRGTDIRLGGSHGDGGSSPGGHDQVAGLGGLLVIGMGRHASSRLDDQLRGRSGRQGDPGGSVFFLSLDDELITTCVPDAPPVPDAGPDGRVTDPKADWTVGHAQRVAEGVHLQIHRDTWRYNTLLEDQRRTVLEHRGGLLRTDIALRTLAESFPERTASLRETVPENVLTEAARQISLAQLDHAWAEYLAQAADLREGINLRALGHGPNPFGAALNPLEEYNREMTRLFSQFRDDVTALTGHAFRTVTITADGADLAAGGLARPSATWTYVVQDNPFGTDFGRAVKSISRMLGRR